MAPAFLRQTEPIRLASLIILSIVRASRQAEDEAQSLSQKEDGEARGGLQSSLFDLLPREVKDILYHWLWEYCLVKKR